MRRNGFALWLIAAGFFAAAAPAAPVDPVRTRIAGYKQLGAAYKTVNDSLRSGAIPPIQQAARVIELTAREQYKWFPKGSGQRPGVKTAALPDIWTRGADFRAAQDAFARQAVAFRRVAAGGDAALIRAESRKLGAACKGCHDKFRAEDD